MVLGLVVVLVLLVLVLLALTLPVLCGCSRGGELVRLVGVVLLV